MEQTLHLIHPSEGWGLQLLVLPVDQDVVDHGGQHGVGVLVLVTLGVGELHRNIKTNISRSLTAFQTLKSTPLLFAIRDLR